MSASNRKKYIIAGIIGLVTVAGAVAYLQYKKLMNYSIKFRGVNVRAFTLKLVDFDVRLVFQNNSNIAFTIESQVYDIYLNNIFITKLQSHVSTPISANGLSPLDLNVKFNPLQAAQKLNITGLQLLKDNGKIRLRLDMKMKVRVWGITFNFPYSYEDSLKNWMGATE